MDGTIINKFYADVDNLGLRFPVAEISNKTGIKTTFAAL